MDEWSYQRLQASAKSKSEVAAIEQELAETKKKMKAMWECIREGIICHACYEDFHKEFKKRGYQYKGE